MGLRVGEVGLGQRVPLEVHAPIEASLHNTRCLIGKGVCIDNVDNGNSHVMTISFDSGQKWFYPHGVDLAVAVQEYQHLNKIQKTVRNVNTLQ